MNNLVKAARNILLAVGELPPNKKLIRAAFALQEALAEQALQKLSDFHQSIEQWPTIADLDSDVGEKPTKEELTDVLVPWYEREDSTNVLAEPAKQEPVVKYPGCDYCNDELFCGRKCKCCGKVFIEDEDFVQSEVKSLRQQVAALKAVLDAWNNVEQEPVAWVDLEQWQSGEYDCFTSEKVADYMTPLYATPVRKKDLTDDEISKLRHKIDWTAEWSYVNFARAVIAADREKNK